MWSTKTAKNFVSFDGGACLCVRFCWTQIRFCQKFDNPMKRRRVCFPSTLAIPRGIVYCQCALLLWRFIVWVWYKWMHAICESTYTLHSAYSTDRWIECSHCMCHLRNKKRNVIIRVMCFVEHFHNQMEQYWFPTKYVLPVKFQWTLVCVFDFGSVFQCILNKGCLPIQMGGRLIEILSNALGTCNFYRWWTLPKTMFVYIKSE